uniref:Solute carrier family 46 member 2 n=1 Tax=Callorhinchus milii TaxID=7868 RepID=A0A4W3KEE5_CALMI
LPYPCQCPWQDIPMCEFVRTLIEPVVALNQIGTSALYDTALLMVVKELCNLNSTLRGQEHSYQGGVSHFYMIYNLVAGLTSLIFTCTLARLGDRRSRKLTICVPLLGYLISRALLLLTILLRLPLEVMFGAAALYGVSGGFTAYWTGIMAIASVTSSEGSRATKLITVELVYGLSGLLGSLASGHIFIHFKISHYQGAALVCLCLVLYTLSLLYSIFVLKVPPEHRGFPEPGPGDTSQTPWETSGLPDDQDNTSSPIASSVSVDIVTLGLLLAGGVLFELAVTGGIDVLSIFVLKEPLSWNAVWVGYGNAAGYCTFMTSYLGVRFFSRCLKSTSLIVIGMVSFSSGILIMAFVKWTFLFFIARAVMMFALIPLPTIRAVISKQIQCTSYGKMFAMLQILLTLTSIIASTLFIQIYRSTKDWFPGFCFCLSTIISCLSIIPIMHWPVPCSPARPALLLCGDTGYLPQGG